MVYARPYFRLHIIRRDLASGRPQVSKALRACCLTHRRPGLGAVIPVRINWSHSGAPLN